MACQSSNIHRGGACIHHPEPVEVHLHPTLTPLITISGLEMRRDDRVVLRDVNLIVNQGDFIAITGPNGGGKTTLLRIILGLLKPTAGSVTFGMKRPDIGYLPQKNMVDSHFPVTVEDVVRSGLLGIKGLDKQTVAARVADTLERIEMADLASRPIGRLSGGQLQRALLGRAIVSKPHLLVLDEPLSYIDKHFEAHIYRLLGEIAPECTTLLVSHEMSQIASMANRHLLVDHTVKECTAAMHYVEMPCGC